MTKAKGIDQLKIKKEKYSCIICGDPSYILKLVLTLGSTIVHFNIYQYIKKKMAYKD